MGVSVFEVRLVVHIVLQVDLNLQDGCLCASVLQIPINLQYDTYNETSFKYRYTHLIKLTQELNIRYLHIFKLYPNFKNSTDKTWKMYVMQLWTQSPIGRKRKKTCDETIVINYISMWYTIQNVAFHIMQEDTCQQISTI
jgi:hypothetical protein